MSYTELHKGKLVPVKDHLSTGEFLEWLESALDFHVDDLEEKIEDEYDTLEVFNTEDELVYLFTKNVLYKVTDYSGGEYCSDEISLTVEQPDGSIDFMYLFYNGGTCFSEMLEEGLERINLKEE